MSPTKTESATDAARQHASAAPAAWYPGLDAACARAVARARQAGHPIVLAVSERLPPGNGTAVEPAQGAVDPLAALAAVTKARNGGPPERRFYWEQPASGFALAAGGRALGWHARGARRFASVSAAVEGALAEAEAWAPAGESPLGAVAVGGFSFFDAVDARAWPGFEPADLGLPAWAVVRAGDTSHWLVQTAAAGDEQAADVRARVEAGLTRLRAAGAAVLPDADAPAVGRVAGMDPPEARAHWTGVVRTARDAIRGGQLRKVVLARPLDLECTPAPDPLVMLARLRSAYPDCTCFLADPGAGQAYLGATPERLAKMDSGRVTLGALAGTFPRGATPEADAALRRLILESPKEREEHAIVVDAICAALESCGRLDLPDEPEAVAFKNVWHLFTPITLVPEAGLSLLGLVERLHPTPAVGGLPREAALDLMRRLESFDRGWYGGPLGWLNARGEGEFAVTLRSGVVSGGHVRLFAGGGIVAESDPEREFEETRFKFQPLLGALGQE